MPTTPKAVTATGPKFIIVEDDGTVRGPYDSDTEAIRAGVYRLTSDETLPKYRTVARLLASEEATRHFTNKEVRAAAIELIRSVDWIVINQQVYNELFVGDQVVDPIADEVYVKASVLK